MLRLLLFDILSILIYSDGWTPNIQFYSTPADQNIFYVSMVKKEKKNTVPEYRKATNTQSSSVAYLITAIVLHANTW